LVVVAKATATVRLVLVLTPYQVVTSKSVTATMQQACMIYRIHPTGMEELIIDQSSISIIHC
jgi:hypothetical protein